MGRVFWVVLECGHKGIPFRVASALLETKADAELTADLLRPRLKVFDGTTLTVAQVKPV